MSNLLIIGITGGTGGGKTTLLRELEAMGAVTLDCDAIYHSLLCKSREMLEEIESEFTGVVRDGALDRKALGSVVFGNEAALLKLNTITHKYVAFEVDKRLSAAENEGITVAAVDAIALIESGLSDRCDVVIGVLAPRDMRVLRIMAREGISREYAEKRIDAQKTDDFFKSGCDYVLINDFETEDEFRSECRKLLQIITKKGDLNEHL